MTPWRVVNMHMGECLGGWSFFDRDYKKSLEEFFETYEEFVKLVQCMRTEIDTL